MRLSSAQLAALIEGLDWVRVRARPLANYRGVVQCDGYASYKKSIADRITVAFCWSHPRGEAHSGIASWFAFYNTGRPTQALGQRTQAVWREAITGELANMAVDMTPRLDNACALPTCPQPQQRLLHSLIW